MRFTIRDVIWLTVVVALGVGWWIEWRRSHGDWSIVVTDGDLVVGGLNPGDKIEFEVLPTGDVSKRVVRRRP